MELEFPPPLEVDRFLYAVAAVEVVENNVVAFSPPLEVDREL